MFVPASQHSWPMRTPIHLSLLNTNLYSWSHPKLIRLASQTADRTQRELQLAVLKMNY